MPGRDSQEVTGRSPGAEPRVAAGLGHGDHDLLRRARFQPLLLSVAALTLLPLVLQLEPRRWLLAYLAGAVVISVGTWWWDRVRPLRAIHRELASFVLIIIAVVGLVLLLLAGASPYALHLLLIFGALGATMAVVPDRWIAALFQGAAVLILLSALILADLGWLEVILVLVQVLALLFLLDTFAQQLFRSRYQEIAARRAAERRSDLLEVVRRLPRSSPEGSAHAATTALRMLAFDAAGVFQVDGDQIAPLALDDIDPPQTWPERARSLVWRAISEGRTIVGEDEEPLLPGGGEGGPLHTFAVAPIRMHGAPAGALLGARREPVRPSEAELEIAEVMAAHLGGVLAARASVRHQRELLERASQLDRMGKGLLEAVSEEVRDPLTIIRGAAQLLRANAEHFDAQQREVLLSRLRHESDDLRLVIDTILDFTRYHDRRVDPERGAVRPERLVAHLGGDVSLDVGGGEDPTIYVEADLELARPALELLLASCRVPGDVPPVIRVTWERTADQVVVTFPDRTVGARGGVLVSLAVQMLVAAGGQPELDDPRGTRVVFQAVGRVPDREVVS
ncbi:MAG: histidine kinase dimerization/phospho-acceptor domain-containing protein [Nitriliruptoraceae bacterium]